MLRDDVVDSIAEQLRLSGRFEPEHALLIRPVGERYQIVSGHHRVEAAKKAGLATVFAWVRDMGDDAAFMSLVLANAQGELSPLEIGMHALTAVPVEKGGRGKKGGLSAYAKAIGKAQQTVSEYRAGAEVLSACESHRSSSEFLDKAKHLAAIHKAPEPAWPLLVAAMVGDGWTVADTQHWAGKVCEFEIAERWEAHFLPYADVVMRFLDTKEFSPKTVARLCKVVEGALASFESYEESAGKRAVEEASEKLLGWLKENVGGAAWDLRKITEQQKAIEATLESSGAEAVETWHHGNWRDHIGSLADGSVALLLTDPPYGIEYQSNYRLDTRKGNRHKEIANDGGEEGVAEIAEMLTAFAPKLATDAHVHVFCHWSNEHEVRAAVEGSGLKVRGSLIWAKNATGMGDLERSYAPKHERIIHAVKGSPVLFSREPDVLEADRTQNDLHPTQKPVDLLARLIAATTAEGQLVIDPFAGSASTLVAANESGRRYWGCEIDEEYFKVGSERLR
jgi:DNA modification methylase